MKQFLKRYGLNILLMIICVWDAWSPQYPGIWQIAMAVLIVAMVKDHMKQEAQMRQRDTDVR